MINLEKLSQLPFNQRQQLAFELERELSIDASFITAEEKESLTTIITNLKKPNFISSPIKQHTYPLIDKSVLITGTSSGIGLGCAEYLKTQGWNIITTVRNNQDAQQQLDKGFHTFIMDYRDSNSIKKLANDVLTVTNGKLGAVFNSGGYGQIGAVEDLPAAALLEQFEANFFGWVELTELLLPSMLENNCGRIVMHGSVLGNIPLNWRGAYNATKFTLRSTTQSYRKKYKSHGISFSLIETGPVRADFRKNALPYFLKNIDQESSRHRAAYKYVQKNLEEPGPINPFTEQPVSVAKRLEHAIESNITKPRYQVTMPSYMFESYKKSLTLDDCLSMSWLDNLD